MRDWSRDPEARPWIEHVESELIPKLRDSAASLSIIPEGEPDVKFSVELGLSIMLDKPIIAVVKPGTKIPSKLALVADHIIEGDITTREGAERLSERIRALLDEMDSERDGDEAEDA